MNYKFEMKKNVEEYLNILQELEGKVSDSGTAIAVLQEIAKDQRASTAAIQTLQICCHGFAAQTDASGTLRHHER